MTATKTTEPRTSGGGSAGPASPAADEFLLDIVTDSEPAPVAVLWFRADSTATARRHLCAHPGPADRHGELYRRHGERGDLLAVLELGEHDD